MGYMFSGTAEITVDDKNRFRFPAKFKEAYMSVDAAGNVSYEDIFIFKDPGTKYITIFPKSVGEFVLKKIKKNLSLLGSNKSSELYEYYCARLDPSKVDSQGRFVVSQKQAGNTQLGTEFVMVGMCDKIALWNKEEFEKYNNNIESSIEDLLKNNEEISNMLNNIFISDED